MPWDDSTMNININFDDMPLDDFLLDPGANFASTEAPALNELAIDTTPLDLLESLPAEDIIDELCVISFRVSQWNAPNYSFLGTKYILRNTILRHQSFTGNGILRL
jgi:hypothetical protein